jgi:N utilization substance protein A
LAPAEISRVIIDETNKSMEVIVPDEFLSIAIGKKGQNVRLASKLTGWHLDVKSETRYSKAMQSAYDSLVSLPGIGISMADALYELGFYSAEEVSTAAPEDLIQVRGIGEEKARKLIAAAQTAVIEAEQAEDIDEEEMAEAAPAESDEQSVKETESDSEKGDELSAEEPQSDTEKDDESSAEETQNDTEKDDESSAEETQNDTEKDDEPSAEETQSDTEKDDEPSAEEPQNDTEKDDEPSAEEPQNDETDTKTP